MVESETFIGDLGLWWSNDEDQEAIDPLSTITNVVGGRLAGIGRQGRDYRLLFDLEPTAERLSFDVEVYHFANRLERQIQEAEAPRDIAICPIQRRFDLDL